MEELIKSKAIEFLNTQKTIQQAVLKASARPKGVLLKYSDFVLQAKKDFNTLQKLEEAQRFNSLEIAKSQDPWKLITEPRIIEKPVSPKKLRIIFLGFLSGLFAATIYSYYKDPKKTLFFLKMMQISF